MVFGIRDMLGHRTRRRQCQALATSLVAKPSGASTHRSLLTIGSTKFFADNVDEKLLGLLSGFDGGCGVALAPEGILDPDAINNALLTLESAPPACDSFEGTENRCLRITRSALLDEKHQQIGLLSCPPVQILVFDMLKRRQLLSIYIDWMSKAKDLRRIFQQFTTYREMYIAVLHSASPATQACLAMLMAKADVALPLVYSWSVRRLQSSGPPANQSFYSMANFHVLQEVSCIARHPLLVNIGTYDVKGKTTALQKLFTLHNQLFLRHDKPSSVQRAPGIDVLPDLSSETCRRNLTLVDVHRADFGEQVFSAAMAAILSFTPMVLLHTAAIDLQNTTSDAPFGKLLNTLAAYTPVNCRIVVLFRDSQTEEDDEDLSEQGHFLNQEAEMTNLLKRALGERFAFMIRVPDMSHSSNEKDHWLRRAWIPVLKQIDRARQAGCAPRMAELHEVFMKQMGRSFPRSSCDEAFSKSVVKTLTDLAQKEEVMQQLFPMKNGIQQLLQLREDQRKPPEDQADDIARSDELAQQMARLMRSLTAPSSNQEIQAFADMVATGGQELVELHYAVGEWKVKWQRPLIDQLNTLHKKSKEEKGVEARRQLEIERRALAKAFNDSDVSVDTFWQELLLMNAWQAGGMPEASLQAGYVKWLRRGQPVQLLHGNPLAFGFKSSVDENEPRDCLPSILEGMAAEIGLKDSPITVISVLGQQSSGKSTLLNFLFGCSFVTLAGRCTMGLFVSLIKVGDQLVAILDSEGVLSPDCTRDTVFDTQIAMMALACSHVVVVNSSGQLGKPMLDLLQVCLYVIKRLEVCQVRPVLVFVYGQQNTDWTPAGRRQTFSTSIYDPMQLGCQKLSQRSAEEVKLDDLLQLSSQNFFTMTPAFSTRDDWNGQQVCHSSQKFAEQAMEVRECILASARDAAACGCPWSASIRDWYGHASLVWSVLEKAGSELLGFKDVFEAELATKIVDYMHEVEKVDVHGYLRQCLEEEKAQHIAQLQRANLDELQMVHKSFCSLLEQRKEETILRLNDYVPEQFAHNRDLLNAYRPIYRNAARRTVALFRGSWQSRYEVIEQQKRANDRECLIVQHCNEFLKTVTTGTLEQQKHDLQRAFEDAWERYGEDDMPNLSDTQSGLLSAVRSEMQNRMQELPARRQSAENVQFQMAHNDAMKMLFMNQFSTFCSRLANESDWGLKKQTCEHVLPNSVPSTWQRVSVAASSLTFDLDHFKKLRVKLLHEIQGSIMSCIDQTKQKVADLEEIGPICKACLELSLHTWEDVLKMIQRGVGLPYSLSHYICQLSIVFSNLIKAQSFEVVRQLAQRKQAAAQEELEKRRQAKESLREWCVKTLCDGATEKDTSALMGKNLFESMEKHLMQDYLLNCVEGVAAAVLNETQDPEQAVKRAFDRHFPSKGHAGDYKGLCKYMLNPQKYLEMEFCEDWKLCVQREHPRIKSTMDAFLLACEQVENFLKRPWNPEINDPAALEKQLAQSAMPATEGFLRAACLVPVALAPKLTSFQFTDSAFKSLRDAFHQQKMEWCGCVDAAWKKLFDKVNDEMQKRLKSDWNQIRGCSATCPICKAKCCIADPHHGKEVPHKCHRHMSSAFGGTHLYREPDKPAWDVCCDPKSKDRAWVWHSMDGEDQFGSAHEMLKAVHPDWLEHGQAWPSQWCFQDQYVLDEHVEKYQLAWVHIKEVMHLIYPGLSKEKCLHVEHEHKFRPYEITNGRRVTEAGAIQSGLQTSVLLQGKYRYHVEPPTRIKDPWMIEQMLFVWDAAQEDIKRIEKELDEFQLPYLAPRSYSSSIARVDP